MARLLRRLRYWFQQRDHEAALREELDFHRVLKQQELESGGIAPDDARFAATREMGNLTLARENARAVWISPWLEGVWQDARFAVRALRRQPGFVLLSVTVLGATIGLNTSLFTVFAGVALRPMDAVSDPATLLVISGRVPESSDLLSGLSFPEFESLAAGATTAELAAELSTTLTFATGRDARMTSAYFVTGNYFDVLGVQMHLGRGFFHHEGTRGAFTPVVVISYSIWQTRFGSDPSILGRTVYVGPFVPGAISTLSEPHTVVGVAPRGFIGGDGSSSHVWLPMSSLPRVRADSAIDLDRPQWCCFEVFARLKPAATREQLATELQTLSDRFRPDVGLTARAIVLSGTQVFRGRRGDRMALAILSLLFLGVFLVLVLACANVGNLLLAHAAARRSEIAVRLSLGAGRARIVRSLLTEGFLLALLAAFVGLAMAAWLPRFILNEVAQQPAPFNIDPDVLVLAYAIALAALACVACSLAPALHATRGSIVTALKGRRQVRRREAAGAQGTLLAVQVAMTVVLLTSAGLLLRGVAAARDIDLGFPVDDISQAIIGFPQPEYDMGRVRALLPDVAAGLASHGLRSFAFAARGRTTGEARLSGTDGSRPIVVDSAEVSPSYFDVMGLPLTAGRSFVESDRGRDLAVVNETLARRLWGRDNPVGRSFESNSRTFDVIGVVRDARVIFAPDGVVPAYFQPLSGPQGPMFPVVLFRNQPSAAAAIRGTVTGLEPRALVEVTPLRSEFDAELGNLSLAPLAASTLGLFGLGLATVGMFSVFACAVQRRRHEIGIRISLGAPPRDVILSVLAGNTRAVVLGLVVGVLGAWGASQLLRRALYGLSPLDPITYGGVMSILAMSAMVASYVPARRALRLDAATTLRAE